MRSCVILLSATFKNIQQISSFAVDSGLASETAEFGKHDRLVMLAESHRNVKQIFKFAVSTALASDTAEFEEHDYLIMLIELSRVICQPVQISFPLTCSTVSWRR